MDFPKAKVLLISRLDGTRGPLGVAKSVHLRLARNHACQLVEVSSFADVLKLIIKIPFAYKGYSICVHQNGFRVPMALCMLSKVNRANDYYLVVHGIAAEESKYRPVLPRDLKLEPKLIKKFPNLICVSKFEAGVLERLYGRTENVTVIGNGVDLPGAADLDALLAKKRSSNPPVVITTGGFEERKGCDLALFALTKYAALTGVQPRLIVCGRDSQAVGSNRALCERMAKEGGVELDYRGEISDKEELMELYRESDFYAGLSRFDTFNVSVLEGAASCCVPIVSKECGAAALFDETSSICCDINEASWVDEAASSLLHLCSDNDFYREAASRSYAVAAANTWDAVAERYWEVLSNDE